MPVVSYRTDRFPGFYVADSGYPLDHRVDEASEIVSVRERMDALGLSSGAPRRQPDLGYGQLDPEAHDAALAEALDAAATERDNRKGDDSVPARTTSCATAGSTRSERRVALQQRRLGCAIAVERLAPDSLTLAAATAKAGTELLPVSVHAHQVPAGSGGAVTTVRVGAAADRRALDRRSNRVLESCATEVVPHSARSVLGWWWCRQPATDFEAAGIENAGSALIERQTRSGTSSERRGCGDPPSTIQLGASHEPNSDVRQLRIWVNHSSSASVSSIPWIGR